MGPGKHRPTDEEYWEPAWSSVLFAGDLFEAIPFVGQPVTVFSGSDEGGETKHFLGEVRHAHGLLITPTCDMYDQLAAEPQPAHPYRVLVPVLPLAAVAQRAGGMEKNVGLILNRDSIVPYMYLPPLEGALEEESVACLFRPTLLSDELLTDPPRRVAQLGPEARRHLKVKLARYWARANVDPNDLPLREKKEEQVRAQGAPPSAYDAR